jgi:hypothetical protein
VVVYVTPAAESGDALVQTVDGAILQAWPLRVIRLWEEDALAALASGSIGLAVLSPLMRNASVAVIEQAIVQIGERATPEQQADLLAILGVFAEPYVPAAQFVQRVGKERLMASDLVSYLMEEQTTRYVEDLQRTLEAAIVARFPAAPLRLASTIHQITSPDALHRLIITVVGAADLVAIEQALAQTVPAAPPSA